MKISKRRRTAQSPSAMLTHWFFQKRNPAPDQPSYLRARGWKLYSPSPEAWRCNGVEQVTSQARHTQFMADLQPLRDALNAYPHSPTPPDAPVDNVALEGKVAALTARLEALPPIDPHLAVGSCGSFRPRWCSTSSDRFRQPPSIMRGPCCVANCQRFARPSKNELALAAHTALFGTTAHNPQR